MFLEYWCKNIILGMIISLLMDLTIIRHSKGLIMWCTFVYY
jgi:hypothetical protein